MPAEGRQCPSCGSLETTLVQRGLAGATDERDQYYTCIDCGRVTYEIVSRTPRQIRSDRLEAGRQTRVNGNEYIVSRVLKVGLNEALVYVKPVAEERSSRSIRPRPSRH